MSNSGAGRRAEEIFFGKIEDKLPKLCSGYSKIVVIAGKDTAEHWLNKVQGKIGSDSEGIIFDSGEPNKNLKTVENLCRQLRRLGCDRNSLLISLGGGVTNDIVGFVASIYMRGVDWITLPTTVLAQADASIGGKTGVNLDNYKNMAGSYYHPKAVLVDKRFLSTLPEEFIREGLGEIIKMGFICDKNILAYLDKLNNDNLLGEELSNAIELAAKAKADIIERDFRESGERKLVNFGHTIGHAVETISLSSAKHLLHGEAVAIGILAEARLAELEGVCKENITDKIAAYCKKFAISTNVGQNPAEILAKVSADKKNIGQNIYWTLPSSIGKGIFNHQASPQNITKAIDFITAN